MDRSVLLLRMFRFLEMKASDRIVAEAEVSLADGQLLCVCAGGAGHEADPARGGTFGVAMDHDPPRFWRKYGDKQQLYFMDVPKLLLAHHITRAGGIMTIGYTAKPVPERMTLTMTVLVDPQRRTTVERVLGALSGVRIAEITPQNAPV